MTKIGILSFSRWEITDHLLYGNIWNTNIKRNGWLLKRNI